MPLLNDAINRSREMEKSSEPVTSDPSMHLELPVIESSRIEEDTPRVRYWRSVEHLENSPEFQHFTGSEFVPGALNEPDGPTRRSFLQVMGASLAFAGLAACRRPEEHILPYTRQPEQIVPGIPLQYATAMPIGGVVRGLLVSSHEGRPSKIEGNPDHPATRGKTTVFEQASILNLYDPDRSRTAQRNGSDVEWHSFVDLCRSYINRSDEARIAILCEPTSSPTIERLRSMFMDQYPEGRWITYSPAGTDTTALGSQLAFGQPLRPRYNFADARVILSLDSDFLGPTDANSIENSLNFAASRRVESTDDDMSRLYAVESAFTNTGGVADHRRRLKSYDIPAFTAALASVLGIDAAPPAGVFVDDEWLGIVAEDLQNAGPQAVVVPGSGQPAEVHALCALINQALGSQIVQWLDTGVEEVYYGEDDFRSLVGDMNAGQIDAVFMIGVNPAYDSPGDMDFVAALSNVEDSVHVGGWFDETAQTSAWHIPRSHYLEAWGDGRSYEGTLSVIQPLIAPLYASHSDVEILNVLITGRDLSGYDVVRETWQDIIDGPFEPGWRRVLHDGYLEGTSYAPADLEAQMPAALAVSQPAAPEQIEVVFRLDPTVYDGRFANNAWLQELPEPVTKLVWDNAAFMSPATAEQLGVRVNLRKGRHYADVISIGLGGQTVELPVWVVPGHADNSITVYHGYGRNIFSRRPVERAPLIGHDTDIYRPGPLANGVGTNVAPLRHAGAMYVATGARVSRVGGNYVLACTQEHGSMEGRPILRSADLEEFREHPTFAPDAVPPLPGAEPWEEYPEIWEENHPRNEPAITESIYFGQQWAMVIDLNTCTGCNACVVACQSENNIQVVGKEQVLNGREMHWIRLDRYFTGDDPENPGMMMQPLPCMHCDNAPCESVCPVAATTTSPDGINEMTYNRCIGTRYCANNCPYKVRRFNFFNWTKTLPLEVQMAQNPDVTMRFRGVMEKCTFCIQRVRGVGRQARQENRTIRDGEVQTACQQVCPSEAIVFGDLMNEGSAVNRRRDNPLRYELLAEYNFKTRTTYLARLRNPNPRLAEVT